LYFKAFFETFQMAQPKTAFLRLTMLTRGFVADLPRNRS
jgi:hypothetical protein